MPTLSSVTPGPVTVLPSTVVQTAAQTMRDTIPVLSQSDPRAARRLAVQASLLLSFGTEPVQGGLQ